MPFTFSILGSGSRGNCTVLCFDDGTQRNLVLLDCGFSIRETRRRLALHDLELEDVSHILLTHLDRDHFNPVWINAARRLGITIHLHHKQRLRAFSSGFSIGEVDLFDETFNLDLFTSVEAIHFAHDALGTVGFIIEHGDARLGFATDLGRVPDHLFDHFRGLHALAFESNYDRRMEMDSERPIFVKRRVMGGMGHLSNEQSLDAVSRIAAQSPLSQIALLHLSQQCNNPRIILDLYRDGAPHLFPFLTVTNQNHPTPLLGVTARPLPEIEISPVPQTSESLLRPRPAEHP